MRQFLRANALASAVGLAFIGAFAQPTLHAQGTTSGAAQQTAASESYIVTFSEDGMLYYHGGVQGISATAAAAGARSRKLDVRTSQARAYDGYLATARAAHRSTIESALGRTLAVTHEYSITLNGLAADMTAAEAARIATLPGVQSVRPAGVEHLVTFRGPKFIGAGSIWDGTATPGGIPTRGQGVIVGDLDGGTNSDHPSFANDPVCGFSETTPKLTAVDCSTSSGGHCTGSNPEANPTYGHGVHTSSTAAGNTIDNTADPAPALPDGISMSGVAPCAAIHQYKVCATDTCSGSAILAGIQNAIADQVDVVNFSISGGTNPWSASDNDRNFLDMVNADIFVAAAAGNLQTGETDPTGEVNHLGPWVMTVAASTQDEVLSPVLSVVGPGTPPDSVTAIPMIPGSTTTTTPELTDQPIKTYPTNITACTASGGIPAGTFTGAIAVLQRGTCSFTEKITNAAAAGAVMVVIGNNVAGSINMDTTGAPDVPAYSLDQAPGNALIAFVTDNADATANVVPSGIGNTQGDVLASFSYTGPTPTPFQGETKPDISAPGVNIYAATDDADGNYTLMSGTSMATPHITGSGALIRAVHPDWTPIEVKSALMTTATNADGTQVDGVTPWTPDEVGSGRVDLTKAALVGLVMDETYANFLAANPGGSPAGDPKTLNLPSMRNVACNASCSWTRTVRGTLAPVVPDDLIFADGFDPTSAAAANWTATATAPAGVTVTIEPSSFVLDSTTTTQTLTITATPTATLSAITFADVVLHEANGAAPDQHLTVAVKGHP